MQIGKRQKRLNGFTIVELIIAIAVIGILAAISIVAYNGIQDRARVTSLMSDLDAAAATLELDLKQSGTYPSTVAAANNGNGLVSSSNTTYQYAVGSNTSIPTYCLTASNGSQSYMVNQDGPVILGHCNLLSNSDIARTGTGEFVQYADLAPIFDKYGSVLYTISFDIKSANVATQNTTLVYMQNGASARYYFNGVNVPVTTSYVRQSVTVTPVLSDSSTVQSILAYYGTYGTGNIVTVKNVKVEFGNTASAWTQGP